MRLVSRVRLALDAEISIDDLFDAPTPAALARRLRVGRDDVPALERKARPAQVPLSDVQRRLWLIDRLQGQSSEYNLAEALLLRGVLDVTALERAIGR